MHRFWIVLAVVAIVSLGGMAGDKQVPRDHASERTWEVVPYQSALIHWHDLPGTYLNLYLGELSIQASEASHFRSAWVLPLGTERKGWPENGCGAVKVRLWVDGTELRLDKTGLANFDGDGGRQVRIWWTLFPAGFFTVGDHELTMSFEVVKLDYSRITTAILHVME